MTQIGFGRNLEQIYYSNVIENCGWSEFFDVADEKSFYRDLVDTMEIADGFGPIRDYDEVNRANVHLQELTFAFERALNYEEYENALE